METPFEQSQNVERPWSVTRGVQLIYASLVLGAINGIFRLASDFRGVATIVMFCMVLFFFGLFAFLTGKISKGNNGVRILFLVLFLLGALWSIPAYMQILRENFLLGCFTIFITLLQLVAMYLLFRRESNLWFKAHKPI
jgi:hypothetical protein